MTNAGLFSTDYGTIMDFSGKRSADIFNEGVVARVNSFFDSSKKTKPRSLDLADEKEDVSDYNNPLTTN